MRWKIREFWILSWINSCKLTEDLPSTGWWVYSSWLMTDNQSEWHWPDRSYLAGHESPGENTAVPCHNCSGLLKHGPHYSTTLRCSCWPGTTEITTRTWQWTCYSTLTSDLRSEKDSALNVHTNLEGRGEQSVFWLPVPISVEGLYCMCG